MVNIIGILLFLALLLLIVTHLKLEGEILFKKEGVDDFFAFKLRLGKLTLYRLSIPSISKRGDLLEIPMEFLGQWGVMKEKVLFKPSNSFSFIKFLIKSFPKSNDEIKNFLNKIQFRQWIWVTKVGCSDPATTGVLTGFLWYLKHFFYRKLVLYTGYSSFQPQFNVIPNFNEQLLDLEFHCIFTFKAGHIITAATRISRFIIRFFISR